MAQPPASSRRQVFAIPPEPTPFIGRQDDVMRIVELCHKARLVTICGPPGIGKSRAALRIATDCELPAWFCDVSAATNVVDLCSTVARTLGLALAGDAVGELGARLRRLSPTLLVLDNFEHLVDTATHVIDAWLDRAPEAKVLISSRQRLRLRTEHVVELAPLQLPESSDPLASDAVQLFVERARSHRPDVDLADREKLASVVLALEGNPLAIELAAARVDVLGLDGLHARIDEQLRLLSRGVQTLNGAIRASWDLLDAGQRSALAALATFRDGFTLEAAEAVLGGDALDRLQDLRDRSLLRPPEQGRFSLYRSIRQYAAERPELAAARAAAAEAHRDYFLAMSAALARSFSREGRPVEPLAAERGNLLAVLDRAIDDGDAAAATLAVLGLGPLLATRGPAHFHLDLLERVLALAPKDASLLHARGLAKRACGDLVGAERDLTNAETEAADGWLHACIQKDLGVLYHQLRRMHEARARYERASRLARALPDRRLAGIVTGNVGALEHDAGNFELAAELYREALDGLRAVSDARVEGIFWTNLGVLEQEEGRAGRARKHYERALTLLTTTPDARFEAIALGNLGLLEHEAGNLTAARARHEQALPLLQEIGDARSEAWCRARLGAVFAELANLEAAEHQLDEAERLVVGRDEHGLAVVRLHRCFLDIAANDTELAEARIGEAQARDGAAPSLVEVSDDARLLLRILAKSPKRGTRPQLEIGPDAMWFRAPGGAVESLEKYAAARNILERLTLARLQGDGALSAAELFAAGWPGVTIAQQSANNRLYVTLAKLRKMGLKLLLLRTEDGYELDRSTSVVRVHRFNND